MADIDGPEWIKRAREPLDLRMASRLLGVHRNTLWAWENGKREPSAVQEVAIKVLGRCVCEFLTGKEI